jgi:transposase
MNIKRVGIDLAKLVFQVHGVDYQDKVLLRKQLRRNQLLSFFAKLSPRLIGMEACGGAHHWARELQKQGHTVKLIAPQFVKPYVKSNKNDANDAEAICEAVGRPSMRFVTIKTVAQQDLQAIHRIRNELVRQRTTKVNQIRGSLLAGTCILCAELCLSCLKMPVTASVSISGRYWMSCGRISSLLMNGWRKWTKKSTA